MGDHQGPGGEHPSALLSAFLDDELDDGLAAWVTRHVAACEACVEELAALRSARQALRGLPDIQLPASLMEGVTTAARDATGARRRHRQLVSAGTVAGMGRASLLVAAFVAGAPSGDVTPPVERFVVDHVVKNGGGPMIVPVDLSQR